MNLITLLYMTSIISDNKFVRHISTFCSVWHGYVDTVYLLFTYLLSCLFTLLIPADDNQKREISPQNDQSLGHDFLESLACLPL